MTRFVLALLATALLTALVALPLAAQIHIDAGAGVGMQSYESSADSPRVVTGVELLVRGQSFGVHLAGEYADLTDAGHTFA
ncbi:MAG: hypothetical protein JWO56_2790 [Acidobacteria bacterium]|nr:hypothetical protein [Acidobacteriota bacterium]